MGTEYRPVANLPSDAEDDTRSPDDCDDERSLADVVHGAFADVDADPVELVREIRRDE